ncbi:hypothetical protein SAY86_001599 [Trapa natans]|uniref:Uncharacterized protein n=1 Tax=Trapa natans TaxID=22666 RepID=A0AAN7R1Q1_TRANT|nr:hypothetical protein SAY86_001599 [Trapa natans]
MPEDYYYSYSKNRSGHIPTFGDWDYSNDLPITQYFECARQAGLIRYSSSSGESDQRTATRTTHDLYAPPPRLQGRAREKRCPRVNEQRKASRICDAAQPQTRHRRAAHTDKLQHRDDAVLYNSRPRAAAAAKVRAPKAVDEDLYKIPPELLHSANRIRCASYLVLSCRNAEEKAGIYIEMSGTRLRCLKQSPPSTCCDQGTGAAT